MFIYTKVASFRRRCPPAQTEQLFVSNYRDAQTAFTIRLLTPKLGDPRNFEPCIIRVWGAGRKAVSLLRKHTECRRKTPVKSVGETAWGLPNTVTTMILPTFGTTYHFGRTALSVFREWDSRRMVSAYFLPCYFFPLLGDRVSLLELHSLCSAVFGDNEPSHRHN